MAEYGVPLSFAIDVTGQRDFVYDPGRGLLYITTADGDLERYDVASRTLLTPIDAGTSLNGADITADGSGKAARGISPSAREARRWSPRYTKARGGPR
jgi:hypothetical protein